MAVSEIHAARVTVNRMIAYIMKDKDETVQSESEINQQYHHQILDRGKNGILVRYYTQSNYHRCSSENPYRTFKEFQQKFQKGISRAKSQSKNGEEPLAYVKVKFIDMAKQYASDMEPLPEVPEKQNEAEQNQPAEPNPEKESPSELEAVVIQTYAAASFLVVFGRSKLLSIITGDKRLGR